MHKTLGPLEGRSKESGIARFELPHNAEHVLIDARVLLGVGERRKLARAALVHDPRVRRLVYHNERIAAPQRVGRVEALQRERLVGEPHRGADGLVSAEGAQTTG